MTLEYGSYLNTDSTIPFVYGIGLYKDAQIPTESTLYFNKDAVLSFGNVSNLNKDTQIPIEALTGIVYDATLVGEVICTRFKDLSIPSENIVYATPKDAQMDITYLVGAEKLSVIVVDYLTRISKDGVVPLEWLGSILVTKDAVAPFESRLYLNKDTNIQFDSRTGMFKDGGVSEEYLAGIAKDSQAILDNTTYINKDIAGPINYLSYLNKDGAASVDYLCGIAASQAFSIEYLIQLIADVVTPWESTGSAVISIDAVIPVEYCLYIDSNVATSFEYLNSVIVNPVLPYEYSGSIIAGIANDIQVRGIWSYNNFDLSAENVPTMTDSYLDWLFQIDNRLVKGIAPRMCWATFNPSQGVYDWSILDRIIDRAAYHGKKTCIRLIGGGDPLFTPSWVWPLITWVDRQYVNGDPGARIPIIWDTDFLDIWTTFISALGTKYGSNPNVQRIAINCGHAGELWYLWGDRMTNAQIQQVLDYGFVDNFIPAWYSIIDAYATAFPTKNVVIDLAKTVNFTSMAVEGNNETLIADYAISKFGSRLYIQQDGLKEDTNVNWTTFNSHVIMHNHRANGNFIGYQMLGPTSSGDLRKTFLRGLAYDISYLEVYTTNIRDANEQDTIRMLYNRLFNIYLDRIEFLLNTLKFEFINDVDRIELINDVDRIFMKSLSMIGEL